jgi:ribosomal protein L29
LTPLWHTDIDRFELILFTTVVKVKAVKIRNNSRADLLTNLEELKKELSQLRIAQVSGGQPAKLAKMFALT